MSKSDAKRLINNGVDDGRKEKKNEMMNNDGDDEQ